MAVESPESLSELYSETRELTEQLCVSLETEDYVIQSMPDASPARWHLAHTTWFFETFLLAKFAADHRPFDPGYEYLFNSYYNTIGQQFPRPRRGLLSRPTVTEIFEYRHTIDRQVRHLLANCKPSSIEEVASIVELGIHHEQQHQELLLTDLKHLFSCNPLWPAYHERPEPPSTEESLAWNWLDYDESVVQIGHAGPGFAFDNESPRHRVLLPSRSLSARMVTNGEYLEFIEDGGYRCPELWLSMGWASVEEHQWQAPLYWTRHDGQWHEFTLHGLCPLNLHVPVSHVSYFEADAFARWASARLPTEAEWEVAASETAVEGNFVQTQILHPTISPTPDRGLAQAFGDVWEWTASPYIAYPGYAPPRGALGEYNGKFMCNQYVLRGGSCVTSRDHIRPTYRNFFPPSARWQFSGIRLAQ